MNIIVNGDIKEIETDTTLQDLIMSLKVKDKVMASSINLKIVKKDRWSDIILKKNDKIELLQFVGGG